MNTYLAIITTVLVVTQIIRVVQNTINLSEIKDIQSHNDYILRVYKKIEEFIDYNKPNDKCFNCKHKSDYFDCSQCYDYDEWER